MSLVLATLTAGSLLVLPGGAIGAALGLRGLWLVALSAPFSLACIGAAGVLVAGRVPFAAWQPIGVAVVIAGVAMLARARLARRGYWQLLAFPERPGRWTAAAFIASAIGVIAIFVALVGHPYRVSQTYDAVFHLNAVAWILETGDASSFHLYRITHPGEDNEFYPAGWHGLVALVVQLTGSSLGPAPVAVATNATWLATTLLMWLPGVALLTRVVAGRSRAGGPPAEAIAVVLAGVAVAAPWTLLAWGTLYPTGLATAITPAGLAIAATLLSRRDPHRFTPLLIAAALWGIGGIVAHPRSLFSCIVIAVPLVVLALVAWSRRNLRGGRRSRVWTAWGLVAGIATSGVALGWWYIYRAFDVANRPISDHLNGGPATATQDLGGALLAAVSWAVPPPDAVDTAAPQLALALAVIAGVVLGMRSRRLRWLAIAWILVVVLYAAAAGSNSDFAKLLTGLWYKDKYRLLVLLAVVGIPLAAIAIRRIGSSIAPRLRAAAYVVLPAVAALALVGPGFEPLASSINRTFSPSGFVNEDDFALMGRASEVVGRDAVIVGNPWDGSTLTWALGGVRTLFPHLAGEWSPDEVQIAQHLDRALEDPTVCAAVARTGAHYLYRSPGLLWGQPPEAGWFVGIDRATESAGILTLVAREGSSALYRISACD